MYESPQSTGFGLFGPGFLCDDPNRRIRFFSIESKALHLAIKVNIVPSLGVHI